LELYADSRRDASSGDSPAAPQAPATLQDLANLSPREEEVLRLIAKGLRIADVAALLDITPHTVCAHIKNIYRKRQLGSRAEAALEAQRLGLV
ncbi:MAG TPA: LuxR C-terminal-related transcriptional regulator, partial [Gammaproteobacteria bacterium]|nr:LuxR C-terminal-related transcriptional regulator [Gammaproteobacteria bacterium]